MIITPIPLGDAIIKKIADPNNTMNITIQLKNKELWSFDAKTKKWELVGIGNKSKTDTAESSIQVLNDLDRKTFDMLRNPKVIANIFFQSKEKSLWEVTKKGWKNIGKAR